ncbi:MAG TPA: hypothetical protein VFJ06_09760 [Halococcus sp.]|nr:hypothetical protein [Halococcus sp.]
MPLRPVVSQTTMDKRRLGINLLLVALVFVAAIHAVLATIFNTGLLSISVVAGVGGLVLLFVVNVLG